MLRNYFLIATRNLLKNRIYSIINITGLAIGITCSILILLWVFDELTFDAFHPKSDRLYQTWVNAEFGDKLNSWRSVPLPIYEALKSAHSNIRNTAVSDWGGDHLLTIGEKRFFLRGFNVSEEFLTMFEFPLKQGVVTDVLSNPSSIVITEKAARILFGDEDPMNKIIRVDDKGDLQVSGILKDIPENSSFEFDFLLPYKYWRSAEPWVVDNEDNWGNYSFQVYVELADPSNHSEVEEAVQNMLIEREEGDLKSKIFLYPLLRWHLYSNFENGKERGGMMDSVILFGLIAAFILIIACFNFMNLATARSEGRAKEVGIRKTVGSKRIDLIMQFISESVFIALIATAIAILLAQLLLPYYNSLVDKQLSIDYLSLRFWVFALSIILFTGFVAGSYPAFFLSGFKPIQVLKGKAQIGRGAVAPRKVLVIMQFGFSILLIIGALVIHRQIQLVKNRELGYKQDNLIFIDRNEELDRNYEVLKNELLQSGLVEGVTLSNSAITAINSNNFVGWPGKPEDKKVIFTTIATEYDYTHTMGIKMLMGRDFSKDFKSDTSAIIINKAALDLMDLDDPIGTPLELWGDKRTLIGVTENVLMGSLFTEVKPMFAFIDTKWSGYVSIRIRKTPDLKASLDGISTIFSKHNPAYPFDYTFADVDFQKKFAAINLTSRLSGIFTVLALVITGLGLLGLAAYTAEQRTKEIGIRKVMGATITSIVGLITRDFARLVLIAYGIAAPLSWWLMNLYLERYPIKTTLHIWIFVITGLVAFLFAIFIVTTQTLRAANASPVDSLRYNE